MFTRLELENFGIFNHFEWNDHAKINILIGKNDTGKSQLLKILYSLAKSVEIYHKKSQPNALQESFSTVLANKLIWTLLFFIFSGLTCYLLTRDVLDYFRQEQKININVLTFFKSFFQFNEKL